MCTRFSMLCDEFGILPSKLLAVDCFDSAAKLFLGRPAGDFAQFRFSPWIERARREIAQKTLLRWCNFCIRCRFSFQDRVRFFVLATSISNNLFNESCAQRATLPFEIKERPERILCLHCRIARLNVLYCGLSFRFLAMNGTQIEYRKRTEKMFVRSVLVRRWRIYIPFVNFSLHVFLLFAVRFLWAFLLCLRSLKSHQSINGEQNVKLTWKM